MNTANSKPSRMLALLGERRFLALFITQFLGALNDNVFKAALLVYLSFKSAPALGYDGAQLLALAAGLFVLPFLLLSAFAGQLADIKERAGLTRIIKTVEIALMAVASASFVLPPTTATLVALMALIFLMGAQSTFFGPIKYSLIPTLLPSADIIPANALVGSSTFISILIGTILGTALAALDSAHWLIAALLGFAALGWLASLMIPKVAIANSGAAFERRPDKQAWRMIKRCRQDPLVWRCILGISWFWTVGAVFLTQLPQFAAAHLGLAEAAVTPFMATLLLGIGIGAYLCPVLINRANTTALALPALLLMAAAIAAFSAISLAWQATPCPGDCARGIASLFERPAAASALFGALLMVAVAGGVFVVPLYVTVQLHADRRHLSSTIATNNILNSLFMVLASVAMMVAAGFSVTVVGMFAATAVFALVYLPLRPKAAPPPSTAPNPDSPPPATTLPTAPPPATHNSNNGD